MFGDDLVGVFFEQSKDIKLFPNRHNLLLFRGRISLLREFTQLVHQTNKDILNINIHVQVRRRVQQLLQRLQVILIRERLNHALHKILLGHSVLADDNNVENSWEDDGTVDVVCDSV